MKMNTHTCRHHPFSAHRSGVMHKTGTRFSAHSSSPEMKDHVRVSTKTTPVSAGCRARCVFVYLKAYKYHLGKEAADRPSIASSRFDPLPEQRERFVGGLNG